MGQGDVVVLLCLRTPRPLLKAETMPGTLPLEPAVPSLLKVFKCKHACQNMKDGQLYLSDVKPEETLLGAHRAVTKCFHVTSSTTDGKRRFAREKGEG